MTKNKCKTCGHKILSHMESGLIERKSKPKKCLVINCKCNQYIQEVI